MSQDCARGTRKRTNVGRTFRAARPPILLAVLVGLAAALGAQAQQPSVTASWGSSRYVAREGGERVAVALRLEGELLRRVAVAT